MIIWIEAHNYRCFPELVIDLDRYDVLAGLNGAGKTTLLDICMLIGDMLRRQRVVSAFLERGDAGGAARVTTLIGMPCQDSAFLQLRDKLREWFPAVCP